MFWRDVRPKLGCAAPAGAGPAGPAMAGGIGATLWLAAASARPGRGLRERQARAAWSRAWPAASRPC